MFELRMNKAGWKVAGVIVLLEEQPSFEGIKARTADLLPEVIKFLGGRVLPSSWFKTHLLKNEYIYGLGPDNLKFIYFSSLDESYLRSLSFALEVNNIPHVIKFSVPTINGVDRISFWLGGLNEDFPDLKLVKSFIERSYADMIQTLNKNIVLFQSLDDLNFFKYWFLKSKVIRWMNEIGLEFKEVK
jgi:hypothetical protein